MVFSAHTTHHCICTIAVSDETNPSTDHRTQTMLASYSQKPSWAPASRTELKYVSSLKMATDFSHPKKKKTTTFGKPN